MNHHAKLALALAFSAGLVFGGCAKKEVTTEEPMQPAAEAPAEEMVSKPESNSTYFAFDKSDLNMAAQATLDANAEWLNANSDVNVVIEGNCDERGTREYNLALGQRRADSVRDYLISKGVSGDRIDTVSYGEERPVCTASGEACWAQNRRADIVVK